MSVEETSVWETIPRSERGRFVEHGKRELITRISHHDKTSIPFVLVSASNTSIVV